MSIALLAFAAAVAALLYAWAVAVRLARGQGGGLVIPGQAATCASAGTSGSATAQAAGRARHGAR